MIKVLSILVLFSRRSEISVPLEHTLGHTQLVFMNGKVPFTKLHKIVSSRIFSATSGEASHF